MVRDGERGIVSQAAIGRPFVRTPHNGPTFGRVTAAPVESRIWWMALYFAANVFLAAIAQRFWPVATVWAIIVPIAGLVALGRRHTNESVIIVAAYVVGAEIVWRGTHARVFWEYGKYVLIVLIGFALLQKARARFEWRALLFIVCLLPSLAKLPFFDREQVAFNLSGPVALGVAVLCFSGIIVDRRLLFRLSVVALGPIVGLAFLATFGTLKADPTSFSIGGKLTTAGFGPNQVSSALGLGLFLVFVLFLIGPRSRSSRLVFGVIGLWLGAQTLLSFSRGGLWTAAGSILVAAAFLVRDRKRRGALLVFSIVAFFLFRFVVFPATDRISGGIASRRVIDTDLTGRDKIMKADWMIFRENPVLGVGPGQSYGAHAITYKASAAHTEYSRLFAEHGLFGVSALLMLVWIVFDRWRRLEPALEKGVGLAFMAWALLYMGHSAMRLAMPALMFGLGCSVLVLGSEKGPFSRRRLPGSASASH